ncbi:MAG TPA: hypothetical protein PLD20_14190 [Blastocatellia bacterium]|nr:hypothetical protein [Blastocatellia bacterium]HMV84155.1 hypothetical protein [Blastocatellia bacterium]HMX29128.1 hypothetical protein [Blastocatellia bacterium]HMY73267.1 hypothetical protein [Blastocatellia bacterium]HMZ19082.1 hypothetical protein [Blastocatellia bacterium]
MSLKTATVIAIIGVGLGMIFSLLSPYIQQAIMNSRVTGNPEKLRVYLNLIFQLRTLIQDGSLILFLVVLLNRQK